MENNIINKQNAFISEEEKTLNWEEIQDSFKKTFGTEIYSVLFEPDDGTMSKRIEDSVIEKVFVTDTIPIEKNLAGKETQLSSKIHVVSVTSLFAEAIDAIHSNKSITRLFE